jgi:hypothetical protein
MDKIIIKEVTAKKVYHNFYCDHCDKFLDTCIEADDGYYRDPNGGNEVRMCMPFDTSNPFVGLLCDDCMKEFRDKIDTTIINIAREYGLKSEEEEEEDE